MTDLMNFDYILILRLVVAAICGGLVGWERGGANHEAGLRTHIIVCLGSASIMIVSQCLVIQYNINQEIMRMGAQIVSGIGFLGAGSIIMDGNRIRGITTAAGLWTTACVGIAIGAGYYIIGFVVVILMVFTMFGLRSVTLKLRLRSMQYTLKIQISEKDIIKTVLNQLLALGVAVNSIKTNYDQKSGLEVVLLEVTLSQDLTIDKVICNLGSIDGVSQVIPG
ncbi:MAG: MgtC/SapB family protein [Clostridiaceae bacterium]|nr:MgtC/SapB family protein [Clostridiaceae bacterium]